MARQKNKSVDAAKDLWRQMLDRAKDHDWSTFDDPEYQHPGFDDESKKKALLEAGWSEQHIELRNKVESERNGAAPVTSPGVARMTEASLFRLSQCVEKAGETIGAKNRDKVHFVVEPKAGPFISKINVLMTDESIISMGSFFTRYCGLISRAYVRTTLLCPNSAGARYDEDFLRKQLKRNPNLLFYWWRIFVSFALTGTHVLTEYKPSTKEEVILMEQMAFAMEIFGLSHEFAHHALDHGRALKSSQSQKDEEFEADAYALKLCEVVEVDQRFKWIAGVELPNPYLSTGAGAILLLGSLDIYRKVKDKMFDNKAYDTHPEFTDRSHRIRNRLVLQPDRFQSSQDFCASVENVLICVMAELAPFMKSYPYSALGNSSPGDWEVKSFE